MNTESDSINNVLQSLSDKYKEDRNNSVIQAGIYRAMGDTDSAIAVLISEIRQNPQNISAKMMIAEIYYERWMIDEAKRYLEQVIEQFPNNGKAIDMLSKIYLSENNTEKSLQILYKKLIFCGDKSKTLIEIEKLENNTDTDNENFDLARNIKSKLDDSAEPVSQQPVDKQVKVVTEIMADLYINQELYDKAAEILQELVMQNPSDLHLRTKLSAMSFATKSLGKKTYELSEELD